MTDASQPQPDRRTIWAVRVIQAVLMIGALALVGHHALGAPSTDQLHVAMSYGNRVNSVLYMVGAACVFWIVVKHRRANNGLSPLWVGVAAAMAWAWPITVLIWFLSHRGSPPSISG
ncbi:MAG TPA: hypothetical protein VL403_10155 [Candidatus Kryptonia bacterium]|nr:hypothetical protein [Candidatus Kryptonia bacterium]